MKLVDQLTINRKLLIKSINKLRAEREELKAKVDNATKAQKTEIAIDIKVINARLSEKWAQYNQLVKTIKQVE
jgi:seryl-tRNA synthetase